MPSSLWIGAVALSAVVGSVQALVDSRVLAPRTLATVGNSRFTEPNSNTLVVQCRPLVVSFTSPSAPKNLSILIALNNLPTPAALWEFPAPPDNNWIDSTSVRTVTWPAVDARQGSIMWVEQHGWGGDVTYLLGDGITVQASTDSSYLGASGSNPDSNQFEGDPSHVAEGQTMIATVTTTFTVPSGFSYSSHSSTTSREHASSRGSSDRPSSFSSTSPSSSPSSSPLPPSSSSKPNIGAIAGGAAEGGFALLSALALFFWRKRNRRRDQGQLEKFGLGGSSEDVEEGGYPPSSLTEVNAFNGVLAVPEVEPWTYTAPSTLLCDPFGRVDDEI